VSSKGVFYWSELLLGLFVGAAIAGALGVACSIGIVNQHRTSLVDHEKLTSSLVRQGLAKYEINDHGKIEFVLDVHKWKCEVCADE
jgi:hypothetical protein